MARGSATLNAPSGCFFRVFLVNTRNTPAGGTQLRRQAVLSERKKGTIRCQPPKSTRPKTTHSPGRRLHAETLYNQTGKRAEGSPEGAMALARGSATLNAPSGCFFRVFLVNTRNTPAGGTQLRRQAVPSERRKGTIRCQLQNTLSVACGAIHLLYVEENTSQAAIPLSEKPKGVFRQLKKDLAF